MKKVIAIEGMSCQHCVHHVQEALEEVKGVKSAKVDLNAKKAVVELDQHVDNQVLTDAIDEAGYEVVDIKES